MLRYLLMPPRVQLAFLRILITRLSPLTVLQLLRRMRLAMPAQAKLSRFQLTILMMRHLASPLALLRQRLMKIAVLIR